MLGAVKWAVMVCAVVGCAARAKACQCVGPRDPDEKRDFIIERSVNVFSGKVLSVKKLPPASSDIPVAIVEARVQVLRRLKGDVPEFVTVSSHVGDSSGSCGAGEALATAWASGLPYTIATDAGTKVGAEMRFRLNGCSSGRFNIPASP